MTHTDIQKHYDTTLKHLGAGDYKPFLWMKMTKCVYKIPTLYININIYFNLGFVSVASKEDFRDAIRAYFHKFLSPDENITCWLNIAEPRISIDANTNNTSLMDMSLTNTDLEYALKLIHENLLVN